MSDLSQNDWALNIDLRLGPGFIDKVNVLDKNKFYYVYCRSGARSAQAVQLMRDLGFSETYNLIGGILKWEGLTVE